MDIYSIVGYVDLSENQTIQTKNKHNTVKKVPVMDEALTMLKFLDQN